MADIKEWELRQSGHRYLSRLRPSYYDTVDACIAFVAGDQWRNIETGGMPTPVINVIKRAISFFVAALTSNNVKIQLSPLPYLQMPVGQDGISALDISQSEIDRLFEEWDIAAQLRTALTKAATIGDCFAHIWFDTEEVPYGGTVDGLVGKLCFELVSGSSVLFGNANTFDIDRQPWIIVEGRDLVENLKAEAKSHKANSGDENGISQDSDFTGTAGDMAEIEIDADAYGKATYALCYKRDPKTKKIMATKCTQDAYIFKDVATELNTYPVSILQWEQQESQYHGRSLAASIIPNQIALNRMMAMVIYNLMMTAFPKAAYNADLIDGWSNEVGEAIPVHNIQPGMALNSVATYLETGSMSSQIIAAMELLMTWTKEAIGMSDAALGNVNPEQASGAAIVASAKQATVPLENVRTQMHSWLERIGRIILDCMSVYYGTRPVVVGSDDNQRVINYDFNALAGMWMLVKADVGASAYWAELASVATLDNLMNAGKIDMIQYLERVPDVYIPRRQELIDEIRATLQQQATAPPAGGNVPLGGAPPAPPQALPMPPQAAAQEVPPEQDPTAEYEQMAQFVDSLPPDIHQQLEQLMKQDPQKYEQMVKEMMMQGAQ